MEQDKNITLEGNIDLNELGRRLEAARKAKGISQLEAAKVLGLTRQTLITMEKGKRRYAESDVKRLADLYGCEPGELIGPVSPTPKFDMMISADIWASLRDEAEKKEILPGEIGQATDSYQKFVDDCTRLDSINGTSFRNNFPLERIFRRRFSETLAETMASQERNRLGLGEQPVDDLRNLLEMEAGIRCLYDDLSPRIAGLFAYRDKTGGVVIVNRNQRPEQSLWTLVRCYACMLRERYQPGIAYTEPVEKPDAKERFVDRFAVCFLMPTDGVLRYYYNIVETGKDFLVADLLQMARSFHVPVESMAQRLWDLRLANRDAADRIGAMQEKDRGGAVPDSKEYQFSRRYMTLTLRAYQDKKLEIKELAEILRTDTDGAQRIVDDCLSREKAVLPEDLPDLFVPLNSLGKS